MKQQHGFTLIEVLVALSIVGTALATTWFYADRGASGAVHCGHRISNNMVLR